MKYLHPQLYLPTLHQSATIVVLRPNLVYHIIPEPNAFPRPVSRLQPNPCFRLSYSIMPLYIHYTTLHYIFTCQQCRSGYSYSALQRNHIHALGRLAGDLAAHHLSIRSFIHPSFIHPSIHLSIHYIVYTHLSLRQKALRCRHFPFLHVSRNSLPTVPPIQSKCWEHEPDTFEMYPSPPIRLTSANADQSPFSSRPVSSVWTIILST